MNYIVLEGISLYIFLVAVILLLLISISGLICAILSDRREFILQTVLERKNDEIKYLSKENFILRIRNGDLKIDDK